jgi:hypothetical protein
MKLSDIKLMALAQLSVLLIHGGVPALELFGDAFAHHTFDVYGVYKRLGWGVENTRLKIGNQRRLLSRTKREQITADPIAQNRDFVQSSVNSA